MLYIKEFFLTFVAGINNFLNKLSYRLQIYSDIPRYAILRSIPHRRIMYKTINAIEIFDLYQLGIFSAPNSLLAHLSKPLSSGKVIQEILELVELQPQAKYQAHYHKKSVAIIYIVSGSGLFQLGNKRLPYKAGKRIEIPAGTPHGFNTDTRTLFLSIQSPPILNPDSKHIDIYYEKNDCMAAN
jgi:quercetin dioxygenase-like cupin family protein